MGLQDQDSEFIDWYEPSEQYQVDQAIFNDWHTRVYNNSEQLGVHFDQSFQDQANAAAARLNAFQNYKNGQLYNTARVQMMTADLNSSLADAKPPVVWKMSDMAVGGMPDAASTIFSGSKSDHPSAYSGLSHGFAEKLQYNFQIALGSANPAFIDATLNSDDLAKGLHLEYNDYGVLIKVDAAGNPTYEESIRTGEQQRVIEEAYSKTVAEVQSGDSKEGQTLRVPLENADGKENSISLVDTFGNSALSQHIEASKPGTIFFSEGAYWIVGNDCQHHYIVDVAFAKGGMIFLQAGRFVGIDNDRKPYRIDNPEPGMIVLVKGKGTGTDKDTYEIIGKDRQRYYIMDVASAVPGMKIFEGEQYIEIGADGVPYLIGTPQEGTIFWSRGKYLRMGEGGKPSDVEKAATLNAVLARNPNKDVDRASFGIKVIEAGKQQLDIPYVLGGDGILSTDCGKFTLDTYNKIGINLGTRLADEQYEYCKSNGYVFTDMSQAKPGDLVFFYNTYGEWEPGTITHVGIYAGDGQMLHASGKNGISFTNLNYEYWQKHFGCFGRVQKQ
jgi:cell wall-associated NlpC family hydrolase